MIKDRYGAPAVWCAMAGEPRKIPVANCEWFRETGRCPKKCAGVEIQEEYARKGRKWS